MISVGGKLRWPLMGVHQSLAGQVGHCFGVVVVVVVVVVVFIFLFWNPPETSIGMVCHSSIELSCSHCSKTSFALVYVGCLALRSRVPS